MSDRWEIPCVGDRVRFTTCGETLEGVVMDTDGDDLETGKPYVSIRADDGLDYGPLVERVTRLDPGTDLGGPQWMTP